MNPAPNDAYGSFAKRAGKTVSNAGLWDLIQDMAATLDKQGVQLEAIHLLCSSILERLDKIKSA